jgi:hypothetical protein
MNRFPRWPDIVYGRALKVRDISSVNDTKHRGELTLAIDSESTHRAAYPVEIAKETARAGREFRPVQRFRR